MMPRLTSISRYQRVLLRCPWIPRKDRSRAALRLQKHAKEHLTPRNDISVTNLQHFWTSVSSSRDHVKQRRFDVFSLRRFLMFGPAAEALPLTKPLLAVARRYNVPPEDELSQVVCKLGMANNILKTGAILSFLYGEGMLSSPSSMW
jgi:hypothetical protein